MCGIWNNIKLEGERGLYIGFRAGQPEVESLNMSSEPLSRFFEPFLTAILESDHQISSHRSRGHKGFP